MASKKNINNAWSPPKKKTTIGNGTYSKKPHSGGEVFHDGLRQGSTPSKSRRRGKAYRGQGR